MKKPALSMSRIYNVVECCFVLTERNRISYKPTGDRIRCSGLAGMGIHDC